MSLQTAQKMVDEALALGNPPWSTDYERACKIQAQRTAAHHAYCEAIGLGKPSDGDDIDRDFLAEHPMDYMGGGL